MARVIKRGDIWIVNLEPGSYRELHKIRPALILSHDKVHEKTSHAIIIPTSSQVPKMIGVEMVAIGRKEGLTKSSVLLPLFIRSVDQDRLAKKIGSVSEEILSHTSEILRLLLAVS